MGLENPESTRRAVTATTRDLGLQADERGKVQQRLLLALDTVQSVLKFRSTVVLCSLYDGHALPANLDGQLAQSSASWASTSTPLPAPLAANPSGRASALRGIDVRGDYSMARTGLGVALGPLRRERRGRRYGSAPRQRTIDTARGMRCGRCIAQPVASIMTHCAIMLNLRTPHGPATSACTAGAAPSPPTRLPDAAPRVTNFDSVYERLVLSELRTYAHAPVVRTAHNIGDSKLHKYDQGTEREGVHVVPAKTGASYA
ncbi:hypothetical protein AURDEDRAFT_128760 [Auricularia subglabra TFB-10046 SS5]|nr:hypothetical protein AURDEDRAFT_128760 [Auricularia subglabra TFB-10046 SS5]